MRQLTRLPIPEVQLRRRHSLGTSAVTNKYLAEGDRPAVDLEIWGENQQG